MDPAVSFKSLPSRAEPSETMPPKPAPLPRRVHRAGMTMIEIVLVAVILSILTATLLPRVAGLAERSRVAKTLILVDVLRKAGSNFRADMGKYGRELAGGAVPDRELSAPQTTDRWKGPYIERPLVDHMTNPFRGRISLFSKIDAHGWIPGFDLDGDGKLDVKGSGNMLWLSGVPESAAKRIDRKLDEGTPGVWAETGGVRWKPANEALFVLLGI